MKCWLFIFFFYSGCLGSKPHKTCLQGKFPIDTVVRKLMILTPIADSIGTLKSDIFLN